MNGERVLNFLKFCIEDEKEDFREVEQVLRNERVDVEGSEKKAVEMINKAKVEVKAKVEKKVEEGLSEGMRV